MASKTARPDRDKDPDKGQGADGEAPPATGRKLPLATLGIALGVLLMEATTVAVMMWLNRGPARAEGAAVENNPLVASEDVEELLLEGKAVNTKRGVTYAYRFKIYAVLGKQDVDAVKSTLEKRRATVEDTVRQVVARLDPKDLDEEPKLITFRRTLMTELEPVFGANKIKQLLVPEWSPMRLN